MIVSKMDGGTHVLLLQGVLEFGHVTEASAEPGKEKLRVFSVEATKYEGDIHQTRYSLELSESEFKQLMRRGNKLLARIE
jgi:hypothetical protein